MAGQLRICTIEQYSENTELPFGATIEKISDLAPILEEYFVPNYYDKYALPENIKSFIEEETMAFEAKMEQQRSEWVLDVYVHPLY